MRMSSSNFTLVALASFLIGNGGCESKNETAETGESPEADTDTDADTDSDADADADSDSDADADSDSDADADADTDIQGVLINELLIDPEGSDGGLEWVELYNSTGASLDLTGASIYWMKSSSSTGETDPFADLTIEPGAFLLLGEEEVGDVDLLVALDLGNGSGADGVYLLGAGGKVVDAVVYGGENTDAIPDETGKAATSLADDPGSGEVLARCPSGFDTNQSGEDFQVLVEGMETPGSENINCVSCSLAADVTLVINEVVVDADGSDGGYEWIEIYNDGSATVDVSYWQIWSFKSDPDSASVSQLVPESGSSLEIEPGGFLLVGESEVVPVPDVVVDLDFGNGTNGDGIHLVDCEDTPEDAIVYSTSDNADGIYDEDGVEATSWVGISSGDSGSSLARYPDGWDTNRPGDDFCVQTEITPGAADEPCP